METMVMSVLLIIANVLGTGMIVPQLVRLHRRRVTDGVSGLWVGVGVAMNLWWLGYGLQAGLWGLIPVSAIAGLLYLSIARGLLSLGGTAAAPPMAIGAFGLGLLPLPFLLIGGWELAGVAIGFCYGLQFLPAAVTAIRSDHIGGISPTTWIMAWVEAVIWLIYGISVVDRALIVGGSGGALMATIILFRLIDPNRRAPATGGLPSPVEPIEPGVPSAR